MQVSFGESLLKNRLRYNPQRPDGIRKAGLEDEKMKLLYTDNDWEELSSVDTKYLTIRDVGVPFVGFENEDDVTTKGGLALEARLQETLSILWEMVGN